MPFVNGSLVTSAYPRGMDGGDKSPYMEAASSMLNEHMHTASMGGPAAWKSTRGYKLLTTQKQNTLQNVTQGLKLRQILYMGG